MAHVDDWGVDEEVVAFFTEQLRLPAAWLAEAQALWAQYSAVEAGQLDHLLAAGDWPAAHALLCEVVAPRWLLAGGWVAGVWWLWLFPLPAICLPFCMLQQRDQSHSSLPQTLLPHICLAGAAHGPGAQRCCDP